MSETTTEQTTQQATPTFKVYLRTATLDVPILGHIITEPLLSDMWNHYLMWLQHNQRPLDASRMSFLAENPALPENRADILNVTEVYPDENVTVDQAKNLLLRAWIKKYDRTLCAPSPLRPTPASPPRTRDVIPLTGDDTDYQINTERDPRLDGLSVNRSYSQMCTENVSQYCYNPTIDAELLQEAIQQAQDNEDEDNEDFIGEVVDQLTEKINVRASEGDFDDSMDTDSTETDNHGDIDNDEHEVRIRSMSGLRKVLRDYMLLHGNPALRERIERENPAPNQEPE